MRELVIVISDFYLAADGELDRASRVGAGESLPSVSYMARFGEKSAVEGGWRSWLARWLGREDLAGVAPAMIASAASEPMPLRAVPPPPSGTAWFATPVYLIAGLTSLHLDRRSILRLPADDAARLAEDFSQVFDDLGCRLESTDSGAFIMRGREAIDAYTTEPARAVVSDLQTSLPTGPHAPVLRRLGAELEMWLHAHPINQRRASRGEMPVSTLWLWGGGAESRAGGEPRLAMSAAPTSSADAVPTSAAAPAPTSAAASVPIPAAAVDVGFGSDPYFTGLWRAQGLEPLPLPDSLPNLPSYFHAQRMALIIETTPLLHSNPAWTVLEALADLDRRFLAPAMVALRAGEVSTVVLIANDTQLRIDRRAPLKFWRRRPKSGIDALRTK